MSATGFIFLIVGPPIILLILSVRAFVKKDSYMGKWYLVFIGIYCLIALGICGILMNDIDFGGLDTK